MSIFEAIVCGVVQGACEFLPVSSSGHLALLHGIFGFDAAGGNVLFDVMLHLGTLAAVTVAFRRDVYEMIRAAGTIISRAFLKKYRGAPLSDGERMILLVAVSTIPLAFAAFFNDGAEALSARPRIVGALLIVNGITLLLSSQIGRGEKRCASLGFFGALGVGLFQLAATLPGISRSGSTAVGGMAFGLRRDEAVRYSFIMSIPAIIGAAAFSFSDAVGSGTKVDALPCAAGVVTAAATGYLAIRLIKRIARSKNFNIFGIYCILAGTAALIFAK